jgi:hypothetical protein
MAGEVPHLSATHTVYLSLVCDSIKRNRHKIRVTSHWNNAWWQFQSPGIFRNTNSGTRHAHNLALPTNDSFVQNRGRDSAQSLKYWLEGRISGFWFPAGTRASSESVQRALGPTKSPNWIVTGVPPPPAPRRWCCGRSMNLTVHLHLQVSAKTKNARSYISNFIRLHDVSLNLLKPSGNFTYDQV